ncbi:MAG: 8-oxo-dGTP diphosphatase [Candidatus Woesearchaeota archaeon]|jgi:8-oxo-dGTP diphosphatase|nr:8-oxo-dGTP diphosphatase [Candidatus Woesearchaeota archaeon]MDP7181122.1 8-oxo-dGTP diphosphatase [Candidatus Woesearchaeota archaeon]MDP7198257.1 8-oxo-dGTP diphosphatase [Candidatus Woesearchaeota archaeon]MDP7467093.1 8-oxo-dGTP diphosphatase [Candidatus Woesearchaeota archaeon]MDP7646762.1 8-oxo-dGTP diphosphatase [Candidatus Woesearchaeota archaeon]|tara:strand:+ start:1387 stop:1872 length:486 start_codon:yes stop_codon:yes gene_type:complete
MQQATLCVLTKDDKILLGMKQRNLGKGNYNMPGGMEEESDEDALACALRELHEETDGVTARREDCELCAELHFHFPINKEWSQVVRVFRVHSWEGEVKDTGEMLWEWLPLPSLPFDRMWDADKHWLPKVLAGEKFKGVFHFKEDEKTVNTPEFTSLEGHTS